MARDKTYYKKYAHDRFVKAEFHTVWDQHFVILACSDLEPDNVIRKIKEWNWMRYDYVDFFVYEYDNYTDESLNAENDGNYELEFWHYWIPDDQRLTISKWGNDNVMSTHDPFLQVTLGKYPFMEVDRHESQMLVWYVPKLMKLCRDMYISLPWEKKFAKFDYRPFYF